jgi:putative hemolysin
MRVVQLLETFKKTPDHIALVTDEYGGVQGLVTLHDVLESIIGDVPNSSILPETQIVKGTYRTLGGFCMRQIGSIPIVGDSFSWHKLKFKVVKMEGRRVDKVLIYYIP